MQEKEIWQDIKGYEGFYKISNYGRIKSLSTEYKMPNGGIAKREGRILKQSKNKINNYRVVTLSYQGRKRFYVHRLVAYTFIPNLKNFPQVNHIDGNKDNNNIWNLEWCSAKQNVQHAIKNNLRKNQCRSVKQYDINGNFIKEWKSIAEASMTLHIPSPNIINCCKGKCKIIGGYIWRYKMKGD